VSAALQILEAELAELVNTIAALDAEIDELTDRRNALMHQRTAHTSAIAALNGTAQAHPRCPHCPRTFKNEAGLVIHIARIHPEIADQLTSTQPAVPPPAATQPGPAPDPEPAVPGSPDPDPAARVLECEDCTFETDHAPAMRAHTRREHSRAPHRSELVST
jgi:FtsZ-binding cell division protein ZapB